MYASRNCAFDEDRSSATINCDLENNENRFLGLPSLHETQNYVRSRPTALRDVVLTPDRVLKFTIPSFGPLSRRTYSPQPPSNPEVSEIGPRCFTREWIPRCSLSPGPSPKRPRPPALSNKDQSSPTTRAAMSLPVPKITTPYGFQTLGESPGVFRRESLYFPDRASAQSSGTGKGKLHPLRSPSCLTPRKPSYQLMDTQPNSEDEATSPASEAPAKPSPDHRGSVFALARRRLQPRLKKHLATVKTLTPACLKRGRKDGCS